MSFTIITTLSPEFERAQRDFIPTWHANSGAAQIIVHEIDEGSWIRNIVKRAELLCNDLIMRVPSGSKVLALDADCLVLQALHAGFSDEHIISVARWPQVNMGVVFFNLAVEFKWGAWLRDTLAMIREEAAKPRKPSHECDQVVWRPRLHAMEARVYKLPEWEWNYNNFELHQWRHELPAIRDVAKVLHIKGHGDWEYAELDAKLRFAKELWPKELACIESA